MESRICSTVRIGRLMVFFYETMYPLLRKCCHLEKKDYLGILDNTIILISEAGIIKDVITKARSLIPKQAGNSALLSIDVVCCYIYS